MIKNIMARLPAPEKPVAWLFLALVVKGLLFWHMLGQPFISSQRPGSMAVCSGDCESYLGPIDHLISTGTYSPDHRMPGYGALYFLLRSFLSGIAAMNALVVLQALMGAVACYVLAWGVYRLTGSRLVFLAGFALMTVGCTVSDFDRFVLTESPSASLLVFAFGAAMKYRGTGRRRWLLVCSACLGWAYFMRPVMFPICLLGVFAGAGSLIRSRQWDRAVLLVLPILLLQGAWSVRNHALKGKWYLLTETRYYPDYPQVVLDAWGFVSTFEDFKTVYFYPDPIWKDRAEGAATMGRFVFPEDIATPEFNLDSLELRQQEMLSWRFDELGDHDRSALEHRFSATMADYERSMKHHHPFIAYVRTPARLAIKHVLGSSGVQNLYKTPFAELGWGQRSVKLFFVGVYLAALYGALFFIPTALARARRNPEELILAAMLVYGLLVHPVIIRTADVRYLYVFYPLMCICASLFIGRVERFLQARRSAADAGVREPV